jgi:hypothetical protein
MAFAGASATRDTYAETYTHLYDQLFIFVIILTEFGFYVFIRQIVNAKEWLSACGPHATIRPLPGLKLSYREG